MAARPGLALSLCLFCTGLPAGMSQEATEDGPLSLVQTHMAVHSRRGDLAMNMRRRTQATAKTPIPPEVAAMRLMRKSPTLQMLSSGKLFSMIQQRTSMQEVLVEARAHELAIAAMRRFPDDVPLQVACSRFLAASVQWKKPLAEVVGPAGAVDVTIAAIKRHSEVPVVRTLLTNIGAQCDFVLGNRARVNELGGIELALQLGERYPLDDETQTSIQCFFSTQCIAPAENEQKMLDLGYIPKSVKVMHDMPTSRAAGEAVFIFSLCFAQNPANLPSMVDAGVISELVNILRKGLGRFEEIDPIRSKSRVPISAYRVIAGLAGANATYRDALVRAGAIEAALR